MTKLLHSVAILLLFFLSTLSLHSQTLRLKPLTSSDDAEQNMATGAVSLTSSDLELGGYDWGLIYKQTVGIRFPNVTLPQGATITRAYIQFSVDETASSGASILIKAQKGDAATYTTTTNNITSRSYTNATATWNVSAWTVLDQRSITQQTPDLKELVTEAVQAEFSSGNALAFSFSTITNGYATAWAFDRNNPTNNPELVIEYTSAPPLSISADKTEGTYYTPFSIALSATAGATIRYTTDGTTPTATTGIVYSTPITINATTTIKAISILNGTTSSVLTLNYTIAPLNVSANQPSGTYFSPFSVTLSSANGAIIRYTTDGSTPTATTGAVYSTPIAINATTAIKAIAILNNTESPILNLNYKLSNVVNIKTAKYKITTSSDDAEERLSDGMMYLNSSDLELGGFDIGQNFAQVAAVRFTGIAIPANAVITKAYIQFSAKEASQAPLATIEIKAQNSTNAATFSTITKNISSRAWTASKINWVTQSWTSANNRTDRQQTPDITTLVQEAIAAGAWNANMSLVFSFSYPTSGWANAFSFDGSNAGAAELVLEYAEKPIEREILSNVVLNEIAPQNVSKAWIEIFNNNSNAVSLDSVFISNQRSNLSKFMFRNANLAAKAFKTVTADASANDLNIAPFNVSGNSDTLFLSQIFNGQTILLDSVILSDTNWTNRTWGRLTDGAATWVKFVQPSPLASNNNKRIYQPLTANFNSGVYYAPFNLVLSGAQGSTIRYTTDGTIPTAVTGILYSAPITISTYTSIKAFASSAQGESDVISLNFKLPTKITNLLINEVAPAGSTNQIGDWVEIYNNATINLNLDSIYISNDRDSLKKVLSPLTSIASKKWALINLNNTLNLDENNSGTVYLSQCLNGVNYILDSLAFKPCAKDVTFGRQPDASNSFVQFSQPTPNASNNAAKALLPLSSSHLSGSYNQAITLSLTSVQGATIRYTTDGSTPSATIGTVYSAPLSISNSTVLKAIAITATGESKILDLKFILKITNLLINEVAPAGSTNQTGDWVEIYNNATVNLSLDSIYISNDRDSLKKLLSPLTSIASKKWALINLNNALNLDENNSGTVYLSQCLNSVNYILDSISFKPCAKDVTFGRQPDASNSFVQFSQPTPNASNNAAKALLPLSSSHLSGSYNQAITLSLTSVQGATIRYTTDGSTPSATIGTVYSTPLSISNSTVLKAIAITATGESKILDLKFILKITNLLINEVAPAGSTNQTGDWVEIYNNATVNLSLDSIYISNDRDSLKKVLSPLTSIASKKWALINLNNTLNLDENNSGIVYLSQCLNGVNYILDSISFKPCAKDITFGRQPDASNSFVQFSQPTPNASNNAAKALLPLSSSHLSGSYNQAITLSLTSVQGATIRYTTDGSTPSATIGTVYSVPLNIGTSANIKAIATTATGESKLLDLNFNMKLSNIFINEITAAGSANMSLDWVEIYNGNDLKVVLDSVYLTDDKNVPNKFMFKQTPLNSKAFIVVTANDTLSVPTATSAAFGISSKGGEVIYLFHKYNGSLTVLDSLVVPAMNFNSSVARIPDASNNIAITNAATPNASNNTSKQLVNLTFSHQRGIYASPFSLVITGPAGLTIRYTTNGSTPSVTNGTVYTAPISISQNTILRVYAYSATAASVPITQTYIFNSGMTSGSYTQQQLTEALKDLPIVSLGSEASVKTAVESPCSFEFINKFGENKSVHASAGFRIFGNSSAMDIVPKKELRIYFKSTYGTDKLRYKIFEKSPYENYAPAEEFDALDLKSGTDFMGLAQWGLGGFLLSDYTAHEMMRRLENHDIHTRYVHVFFNGQYYGLHVLRERFNENYMQSYFGGNSTDYEVIDGTNAFQNWDSGVPTNGTGAQWSETKNIAATSNFQELKKKVEIKQYVDMMLQYFITDMETEYKVSAYKGYTNSKFLLLHNDVDGFFTPTNERAASNYTYKIGTPAAALGAGGIMRLAGIQGGAYNLEYRTIVRDRVQNLYINPNGVITVQGLTKIVNEGRSTIYNAVMLEATRWGLFTREGWNTRVDGVVNSFPTRLNNVINFFRSNSWVHTLQAVSFNKPAGELSIGEKIFITNPNANTQVYYTLDGSDVVFDNGISPNAKLYNAATGISLPLGKTKIRARAFTTGNFGMISEVEYIVTRPLKISAIAYQPNPAAPAAEPKGSDAFEFFNITNIGTTAIDVSNFMVTEAIDTFRFPQGTSIASGETIMMCSDSAKYPLVTLRKFKWAKGKLANEGENISFRDNLGNLINEVKYDTLTPWPYAKGNGSFIRLKAYTLDNSKGENWEATPLSNYLKANIANLQNAFRFVVSSQLQNNQAQIQWVSHTATQVDYFNIEKLNEVGVFELKEVVPSNKSGLQTHTYFDKDLKTGENVYRVVLFQKNDAPKYSDPVKIEFQSLGLYAMYPNPASEYITLDLSQDINQPMTISIVDLMGNIVNQQSFEKAPMSVNIDVTPFRSGQYFVKIQTKGKRAITKKLTITE